MWLSCPHAVCMLRLRTIRLEYAAHTAVKHGVTLSASSSFATASSAAAGGFGPSEAAVLGSDVLYQAVHARGRCLQQLEL